MNDDQGASVPAFAMPRRRIASGLWVRFEYDATRAEGAACCEWDPALPRRLTGQAWRRYVAARSEFLQRIATMAGGRVIGVGDDPGGVSVATFDPAEAGHA